MPERLVDPGPIRGWCRHYRRAAASGAPACAAGAIPAGFVPGGSGAPNWTAKIPCGDCPPVKCGLREEWPAARKG